MNPVAHDDLPFDNDLLNRVMRNAAPLGLHARVVFGPNGPLRWSLADRHHVTQFESPSLDDLAHFIEAHTRICA